MKDGRMATAVLLAATITGCANRQLERKVERLTAEVTKLRSDLERSRTAKRITLVVREAEIADVVSEIARLAEVQIERPMEVNGKITLTMTEPVDWDVVLETVVRTHGDYGVEYDGPRRARIVRWLGCPRQPVPEPY